METGIPLLSRKRIANKPHKFHTTLKHSKAAVLKHPPSTFVIFS